MKKVFTGAVGGALILGSLGLASPAAQAYDREAFAYASSHFVSPQQLPKIFASKSSFSVQVGDFGGKAFICSSPVPDGPNVELTKPVLNAYGSYEVRSENLGLWINVSQYRSNVAAENAFTKISKDIKKCDGDYSGSWPGDNDVVYPYQTIVTSGKIPAVTVTGVASIFTNQNSNNAAVGDQPAYLSDNFTIITLVNDSIIMTQATTGSAANLTAPQKKALEQVANQMVTAWVS